MAESFKNLAKLASIWVIGGYGVSQALRLVGNMILTRLLVPEFFGIMAIAQVFILGLLFFSDIGIAPGIIRSERSNELCFLNTAWTLEIIRGLILCMMTIVIAYPVSKIYNSPILLRIIPAIGLSSFVLSFSSTSIHTLNKKVLLGKITIMELVSQLIGLICMILLAYQYRSIWALVAGSLVSVVVKTIWSHLLDNESINRFAFEMKSVRELISFGKWIFVSTAMMFLATQADRLLLGKFFSLALFGVYNIAVMFAELPKHILGQLSIKVIFPLMTHFVHLPREEFRKKILKKRHLLLVPMMLLVSIFSSFGDIIICFLYDVRYHQAEWMLPLLALGMWPFVLCASIDRCFYALGNPKIPAVGNLFKFIYMIVFVPLMFYSFGILGGVLAVAINDLPVYIVNSIGLKREGLTCFGQDIIYTLSLLGLVSTFLGIRFILGFGIPGEGFFVS